MLLCWHVSILTSVFVLHTMHYSHGHGKVSEVEALLDGVDRFGKERWSDIRVDPRLSHRFENHRTADELEVPDIDLNPDPEPYLDPSPDFDLSPNLNPAPAPDHGLDPGPNPDSDSHSDPDLNLDPNTALDPGSSSLL